MARFNVTFRDNSTRVDIAFRDDKKTFNTVFNSYQETQKDVIAYLGEYEVEPSVKNQSILETKGKLMIDDVTVKKLPLFKTSNESGGVTVYIGRSN